VSLVTGPKAAITVVMQIKPAKRTADLVAVRGRKQVLIVVYLGLIWEEPGINPDQLFYEAGPSKEFPRVE
jgi:hypothetical protein